MMIGDLLESGAVSARVSTPTKRQALSVMAEIAARNFGLESAPILDALMEREKTGATGVGHGVAIPHAQLEGLGRMRGVFMRLETPIEYGAVDDQPVDLLFALFAPRSQGSDHLRALARVSRLLRDPALREQLRSAHGADAIHALLARETRSSAA
jgi:PTS system nitrogen regulatory IIA component